MAFIKFLLPILLLFSVNIPSKRANDNTALNIASKAAILVDADSGKILYSKNEHDKLYPASMTKMVGLVIILDNIEQGKMKLTDMVTVSNEAASMGGTQIYLQPGEQMCVDDLLKAVAINSANDAIYALAEATSGSEQAFVSEMNKLAKELGMNDSNFVNTNGFDDPNHYTSAYDMAIIARKLVSYGDAILRYTSKYDDYIRKDTTNPFWLVNTNKLIRTYEGMDGLKTGFTQDAGFCLAATAKKDNLRLIAVTMKADTKEVRSKDITTLLNYGFANYKAHKVFTKGQIIHQYEFNNSADGLSNIVVPQDVYIIIPKGYDTANFDITITMDDTIKAPINNNQIVGKVVIKSNDGNYIEKELVVLEDVEPLTWWKIIIRTFKQLIVS